MDRRAFLSALTGSLLAAPLAAEAQQANRIWRIGFLSSASGPTERSERFLQGLRDVSYVEGQNLIVVYRWAAGNNERLAELATELVGAGVDVIVTTRTPATLAAKQATRTLPIVFGSAALPVENGLVASLARPGGNATGIALVVDDMKTLDLFKETVVGIARVAYVYDPVTLPGTHQLTRLALYQNQARAVGIALEPIALRAPDETNRMFTALPGTCQQE